MTGWRFDANAFLAAVDGTSAKFLGRPRANRVVTMSRPSSGHSAQREIGTDDEVERG
ncbi:hypothetical protein ACIRQQ_22365 [Streptomyces fuscichromogenes]|uniref:hypothetical protein n=1 Tax=Streptomyces fuscichromogenes TaxID=1324013 RepID=UPI0038049FA1